MQFMEPLGVTDSSEASVGPPAATAGTDLVEVTRELARP